MEKRNVEYITRTRSIIRLTDEKLEIVKKIPVFYNYCTGLKTNFFAISNLNSGLEVSKEGVAEGKRDTRKALEEQTINMSAIVCSIAQENGDKELYRAVYCTPSTFKNISGEKVLAFARNVVKEVNNCKDKHDQYGTTAEAVSSYSGLVDQFENEITGPRDAASSAKAGRTDLEELINQNRFIINKQMKPLARLFKKTDPSFYNELMNSFRLQNVRTRHSKAAGTATDKQTGKVLRGVTARAEGTSYTAVTGRNGGYTIPIPETGFYTFVFEKEGYETVIIKDVEVRSGQTVIVDVAMSKVEG